MFNTAHDSDWGATGNRAIGEKSITLTIILPPIARDQSGRMNRCQASAAPRGAVTFWAHVARTRAEWHYAQWAEGRQDRVDSLVGAT
jgi:hypothetical protein